MPSFFAFFVFVVAVEAMTEPCPAVDDPPLSVVHRHALVALEAGNNTGWRA